MRRTFNDNTERFEREYKEAIDEISRLVRAERLAKKLTQRQLAALARCQPAQISYLEARRRLPEIATLCAILRELGLIITVRRV